MNHLVTIVAKSDQVLFRIISRTAPELFVMDLKPLHRSTVLTSPVIPIENLPAYFLVHEVLRSIARSFGAKRVHRTSARISSRKACCCGEGRNLKNRVIENRSVSGFWLSRFAPARKSAQIISKQ